MKEKFLEVIEDEVELIEDAEMKLSELANKLFKDEQSGYY